MKALKDWNLRRTGLILGTAILLSIIASIVVKYNLLAVGLPTPTPTPCFGCIPPPAPAIPTFTPYPISQVIDLAPSIALRDKVKLIVRRASGQYAEFQIPPGMMDSQVPLEQGDVIVNELPPTSLMGRHPSQPIPQILRQSTIPMRKDEAIDFAIQYLQNYRLVGTPDSIIATQTTWGRFSSSFDPNKSVWFVTIQGAFNQEGQSQKRQMYVIFDAVTSAILRAGSGTPDEVPPGLVLPVTPPPP